MGLSVRTLAITAKPNASRAEASRRTSSARRVDSFRRTPTARRSTAGLILKEFVFVSCLGIIGFDQFTALHLVGPADGFSAAALEDGYGGRIPCYGSVHDRHE